MNNIIKTGIIGPTNIEKVSRLCQKPQSFFLQKAKHLGAILAQVKNCELWINSDKGIVFKDQLKRGNLKNLIAVRELLRGRALPPEIEEDIKDILVYVDKVEYIKTFFENYLKKEA